MEQQKNQNDFSKRSIVVFNNQFIVLSETFIYRQIIALRSTFQVELLGFRLINTDKFDLSKLTFLKLRKESSLFERVLKYLFRLVFNVYTLYYKSTLSSLRQYFKNKNVVVHAHFGWNALFLLPFLKKREIPMVVSFHGNDASGWLNKPKYKRALPELFEYASHIILCSDHMIETLNLNEYKNKVSVVPYGIDVAEFKPASYTKELNIVKILHSGRLVSKKGVTDLIVVFKELRESYPQLVLQIVGDGEERLKCEMLARQLNLTDCVFFFGALPQHKVKDLMNACDIFVLNSRTDENGSMEGLPNSLLEAMAFEKAVVGTRHAGIPMAIQDRFSGLLIPERSNTDLLKALDELVGNEQLRISLGKNAREVILKKFTNQIMTDSMTAIFESQFMQMNI